MCSELFFGEGDHHGTVQGLAPELGNVEAFVGIIIKCKRFESWRVLVSDNLFLGAVTWRSFLGRLTNACIFVLGLLAEVFGIEVGDFPQLLGLVLVGINGFSVQIMLNGVGPELVICAKCM